MIKLIVIDLDGTLLTDDKQLSQNSIEVIDRAQKEGYLVTIATGRAYELTKPYAEMLNIKMPLILNNGALIKELNSNAIIDKKTLDADTVKFFVDYADKNQLGYTFYAEDGFYINDAERLSFYENWNHLYPQSKINLHTEFSDHTLANHPFYKMLMMIPDYHMMKQTYTRFKEDPKFHITKSLSAFFDVLPKATTKATALRTLMKRYHLSSEQILVFGDNTNDIEIFNLAMHSVAMPNATDDLKETAKAIALDDNNHDGVAKTIERFLNENKLQ